MKKDKRKKERKKEEDFFALPKTVHVIHYDYKQTRTSVHDDGKLVSLLPNACDGKGS